MVSLITATLNRTKPLERLLASLDRQSFQQFEVIIVDQNPDDRLSSILNQHPRLNIVHLRCPPGASRARNVGLRVAKGGIIGFPDDDCWYPESLLSTVTEWFAVHPEFDGLFAILRDETKVPTGPKWPKKPCPSTPETLLGFGITPVGFLTRQATEKVGFFDERIGPGAPSGYYSGEDADYFLRALAQGFRMWHSPELTVFHPDFHADERLRDKSYPYAKGGGLIMRLYHFPRSLVLKVLILSAGGVVVNLLGFKWQRARAYLSRGAGVLRGYLLGTRDICRTDKTS
jgi:glycosyltransferase involved in cell wall biosynthesis